MVSLSSAQLEREKIKAAQAKLAFDELSKSVVNFDDFGEIIGEVNAAVEKSLGLLQAKFSQSVGPGMGETEIHYRLTDALYVWLYEVGGEVRDLVGGDFGAAFARAVKPKDLLTVSQWAEKNRVIATGTNLPGPWRNANSPHLTEILDCMSEHSPVKEITFVKSSGVGGSEVLYNAIGYIMDYQRNKDAILVVPTLDLRDREYNPRIDKMIKETPRLAEITSSKSRDTTKRQDMIQYGEFDARLIKTGANSPDSLRAAHVPIAMADEYSAFPWDIGGEGSGDTLISNRLKTFSRSKFLKISTPTLDGTCAITQSWEKSDQSRRFVPCPHCGHMHTLEFKNFHWGYAHEVETDSETAGQKQVNQAWFVCPSCDSRIDERDKNAMLDRGVWIAKYPNIKHHRGFHINAFYIKFGLGKTWAEIAQKWIDAQGDTAALKSFVNTYLGEAWRDEVQQIEAGDLLARVETYPDELPPHIVCAGVDVQKDRLECSIYVFEETEEAWAITHLILSGDTTSTEVWRELDEELSHYAVAVACIDSGYNTDMVHEFCDKRKWCIPVKGVGGMGRPLIEDKLKRTQRLRRRRKKGRPVEPIGTDQANSLIYARLQLPRPGSVVVDNSTGEIVGRAAAPGYIHYPNQPEFDDEFFQQLTAEALVTKKRAGRTITEWTQIRKRNEAIDCLRYALAAYRFSLDTPGLRTRARLKQAATTDTDQAATAAEPTKPRRKLRGR
ncbi:MAG: phage terminase large subunit family protein [Thiomicrospira sp.]|jgi:phage terminase large subunit GpA-like protein|nr:phage terminase large subunit family protein [Thiomicrospira sp.]